MQERPELDEPISIEPYDRRWVVLFEQEAKQLNNLLSNCQIEHIGSTAVPGLDAKPIIDILVGVQDDSAIDDLVCKISTLQFIDMGEAGIPGRQYLVKRSPYAVNVHIVKKDSELWQNNIIIRDYLRSNSKAARSYSNYKRSIVQDGASKLLAYSKLKANYMQDLVQAAKVWKNQS